MDDEWSDPPSEEAEAQRLEPVSPLIWIMVGTLLVVSFVAIMIGLGHPNPKVHPIFHSAPAANTGSPSR